MSRGYAVGIRGSTPSKAVVLPSGEGITAFESPRLREMKLVKTGISRDDFLTFVLISSTKIYKRGDGSHPRVSLYTDQETGGEVRLDEGGIHR